MLIKFMKLFISKKMSERLVDANMEDIVESLGGVDMFPQTFGGTREYVPRFGL